MTIRLFLCLMGLFLAVFPAFAEEEAPPPFPPLEKITQQEASDNVLISLETLKFRLEEYMNATPLRREVKASMEQFIKDIKRGYSIFTDNPRKFLEGVGIKDKVLINQIVAFMEEHIKNSPWYEGEGFSARIVSCAAPNPSDGLVAAGVQISIPRPGFLLREEKASPLISFSGADNLRDISSFLPFPGVVSGSGYQALGYSGTFILPFTFRAENPASPVLINAETKGKICSLNAENCKDISFSLRKEVRINELSFPLECEAVKDALQISTPEKNFTITTAVITPDNELKIEAESQKEPHNPNLLVLSPQGLNLTTPAIAFAGNKIMVIAKPKNPATNLTGEKIRIILGSPYNFTEAEIIPLKEETVPYIPSISFRNAILSGVMTVFFSPVLALLLFLLLTGKNKSSFFKASAQIGLTIAVLYPLMRWLTPFSWGEQFMNPKLIFFSISLLVVSSTVLVRFNGFKGAGIVFGLLALLAPSHYLQSLINQGSLSDFAVAGIVAAAVFASFAKVAQKIPRIEHYPTIVFIPAAVLSFWLMLIIFAETSALWCAGISVLSLFMAFCSLYAAFYKGNNKAFPLSVAFLFIGFIALPYTQESEENSFTEAKLQEALNRKQVVYAYADMPWCLSCHFGKFLLQYDPSFSSLRQTGKLTVLPTAWNNPDFAKYRNLFQAANPPLNLMFGEKARSGIQVPTIMLDYETAGYMQKIR